MSMPPITERDEALIADYLADALAPPQRAEVERRLAAEPPFAAEYRAQARLIALLRALPARPAPRSFALMPEQAQPEVRVLSARRALRPAWLGIASAAAVALLLGGGVLLLNNQPPESAALVAAAPTQAASPAPTLTEADAAIMQLQADLQAQATPTQAASPAPTLTEADAATVPSQRAMPTQALPAPPLSSPDSAVSQAAMPAPAASPPPDSARQVGEAPTDDAESLESFSIMSAPMNAPGLQAEAAFGAVPDLQSDALPRLIAALLRLVFALFSLASSSSP